METKYYKSRFSTKESEVCYIKVTDMVKTNTILDSDLYRIEGLILFLYYNNYWALTDNYELFPEEFEEITEDQFIEKAKQVAKSNKRYKEILDWVYNGTTSPDLIEAIPEKNAKRIISKL